MRILFYMCLCMLITACANNNEEPELPYTYDKYAAIPNSQRDPAAIVATMLNPVNGVA